MTKVGVARGPVVDEAALVNALATSEISGAALDCFVIEPLPAASPLWAMDNVLVTPHSAGLTRAFEQRLTTILLDNLDRLWRGEPLLHNEIA